MFKVNAILSIGFSCMFAACGGDAISSQDAANTPIAKGAIIVDHNGRTLADIPEKWINEAKSKLVVAYGHTSHGSQLIDGLRGLEDWKGAPYIVKVNEEEAGLEIRDTPFNGANDLGAPDFTSWVGATRTYLDANPEVNVVMWSWCGQVSGAEKEVIQGYLDSMSALEGDYPKVRFVLFTGHLDGTGVEGNLNQNNEIIRKHARTEGKILYDFADIESYDPDGVSYLAFDANDNCDSDKGNWCINWQNDHPGDWYEVNAAHSQSLNGNLKAYAAWHLFARLAGWEG